MNLAISSHGECCPMCGGVYLPGSMINLTYSSEPEVFRCNAFKMQ